MKWKSTERICIPLREWSPWFAWYPVRIGKYMVWLERVDRRAINFGYDGFDREYREVMNGG